MKRKFQLLGIGTVVLLAGTSLAFTWGMDDGSGSSGTGLTATCTSGNCSGLKGIGTGTGTAVTGLNSGGSGIGVYGYANGTSGNNTGVYAQSDGDAGVALWAVETSSTGYNYGIVGQTYSSNGAAIYGVSNATTGFSNGVTGQTYSSDGRGVQGYAYNTSGGIGVYGSAVSGYAGYFEGDVWVNGYFGWLYEGFRMDHPLDPANKYLNHVAVVSSEPINMYTGNVQLDANGEAWVTMPSWFDALNRDMRYQLTAVGAPGPNLYVAQKLSKNRFKIAGGQAGSEVSWQVAGVRHDPYIMDHPVAVEQAKPEKERGYYLYPQGYGQPASKRMHADPGHPSAPH